MGGNPRDMSELAFMSADELKKSSAAEGLQALLTALIRYQASHQDFIDHCVARKVSDEVLVRERSHLFCLQFVSTIVAVTLRMGGVDE